MKILSSKHHNTFFHRDCEFGMSNRTDSEGTVEASWYFPAEGESRGFKNIVYYFEFKRRCLVP